MRVYVITDSELEALRSALRENPWPGIRPPPVERDAYLEAYRRLNYKVETWLADITKPRQP